MRSTIYCAIAIVLLSMNTSESWADAPIIAPINTSPEGQTYGRWAAEWWQWALGVPAATNPLLDTSGVFCQERQVGSVWFLAGSFGTDPVVRECDVPYGTALFFPLINSLYGAFLNDPPETRTEEAVREFSKCLDPVSALSLVIDGFAVPRLYSFFTGEGISISPIFNVQFPPENIFGVEETIVPELVLSPSAEQGYYIFLKPLSVGEHTIQFAAEGCFPGFSQNITYQLTVTGDL